MTDFGILDNVLGNFTATISGAWGPALYAYMLPVLMALIVLQFGLVAMEAVIERDIPLLLTHTMVGLLRVGVIWAIFVHSFEWANDIVQSGQVLGANISGFALTPSGVFDTGIGVMQTIFHSAAATTWFNWIFEKIVFFFIGLAVMLAWAIASIVYLGALIESALIVYVAPLIIAFTPIAWTFELLITWGRTLLRMAFKVALILMTLSVGMALADTWVAAFNASAGTLSSDIWNLLIALVEAILFAWAAWQIPNAISGLAGGAAALGFGEALASMAGGTASSLIPHGRGQPPGLTAQEMAARVQTAILKG